MRVSIWDLDYYYAEDKTNLFNPDIMKISSYHKQKGDFVNFVLNEYDIDRPYDLYYIVKENRFLDKNPPYTFYMDAKVRWWGEAYRSRVKWKMSDAMLACRPDYLLYPNKNTDVERAEHIRLFNNKAQLLPLTQEYKNTFKNKIAIVTDTCMWYASKKDLIEALESLKNVKNLSFSEPILYKRLVDDKIIKDKFLELKFTKKSLFQFNSIDIERENDFISLVNFINEIKQNNRTIKILKIKININYNNYKTMDAAQKLFEKIKKWIIIAKENKIHIYIDVPNIHETPFNFFFSIISYWTNSDNFYRRSWLDYLTHREKMKDMDWYDAAKWTITFRDVLRQTYADKTFMLKEWGDRSKKDINIPWKVWENEFKIGV